ncbi:MAG: pyridine nucleotide-disulfide oxidoreductase [Cellvibrionales bacterium]|nr:MAG: pyridine nucleotide-disulfide oxidoreductase [Cellvibrionales bacterium]
MNEHVVIIGGGQAGAQTAVSLRKEGFSGSITIVCEEPDLPYQRPPLSKTYLAGELPKERLFIKPAAFYEKANIALLLGVRAIAIDTEKQCLSLDNQQTLPYSHLVFATGGRVRPLHCPGIEHHHVHYLRTLADVDAMQDKFQPGKRLVIIGGGYVGLETAAVAVKHGLEVSVLVARPTALGRVTSKVVGQFFEHVHRTAGVNLQSNTDVECLEGDDEEVVLTTRGALLSADLVVVGIGLLPNIELAESAGILCEDGINTDQYARTSVANIYAAGDCANHPNAIYKRRMRLQSVQNAIDQAKTVAASICGKNKPYTQIPWFWSDQYELKLQTAGVNTGYDEIVLRGDPETRSFAAFYLRDGRLLAVDAINRPAEFVAARNILNKHLTVSAARLSDESIAAKALAEPQEATTTS